MKTKHTNTKVHRNDDGSICIWFSPDYNARVKYFAKGWGKSLEGSIDLHLLKKREDWGDSNDRICFGQTNWFMGSFYPYQPLGDVKNKRTGLCPPKHEEALLHAIDCIPKIRDLIK